MTRKARKRTLSREEHWLWARVTDNYKPLKGRPLFLQQSPGEPVPPPVPEKAPKNDVLAALKKFCASPVKAENPAKASTARTKAKEPKAPPPLVPMERKTLRAVRRGSRKVDGVIDLHGMYQSQAHFALLSFLRQSQARGANLVLVITGKGEYDSAYRGPDERGVLRRVVPQWLRLPDARLMVVGFDEASQHHGGSGALYVRLRRHKSG